MEMGHSNKHRWCAIFVLVDLSFREALGRCGTHDLATKAFAYISLSFNIYRYARPPDSLSEMLFNLSDPLMALVCQLQNVST